MAVQSTKAGGQPNNDTGNDGRVQAQIAELRQRITILEAMFVPEVKQPPGAKEKEDHMRRRERTADGAIILPRDVGTARAKGHTVHGGRE